MTNVKEKNCKSEWSNEFTRNSGNHKRYKALVKEWCSFRSNRILYFEFTFCSDAMTLWESSSISRNIFETEKKRKYTHSHTHPITYIALWMVCVCSKRIIHTYHSSTWNFRQQIAHKRITYPLCTKIEKTKKHSLINTNTNGRHGEVRREADRVWNRLWMWNMLKYSKQVTTEKK